MSHRIIELNCPGCGARVSTEQKECEWCHNPIVISTFNSINDIPLPRVNKYIDTYKKAIEDYPDYYELNKSIAMCYLKLKLFDKALSSFEVAIKENFDDSEMYFYAAVCLLKGKKAFLAQRDDINKCIEYINAANMIEPRGIYYYFLAYIKYDFFERKYLNSSPNYIECLKMSNDYRTPDADIKMLFDILGVNKPSIF